MKKLWKVLKWMYGDSLRYIGFLVSVAAIGGLAMVFLAYPIQFIFSAIAIFVVVVLFLFFSEL